MTFAFTTLADLVQQSAAHAWSFIPSALLLGALHGLEPGHSKTMMAAFIVAVRGTIPQTERPSWPSPAFCFSTKQLHGSESAALSSPSSGCFCCVNKIDVHFVRSCRPI